MRISDWSSDVCSSDLSVLAGQHDRTAAFLHAEAARRCQLVREGRRVADIEHPGDFESADRLVLKFDVRTAAAIGKGYDGGEWRLLKPDRKSTRLNSSH